MSRDAAKAPLDPGPNESAAHPWITTGDIRTIVDVVYDDLLAADVAVRDAIVVAMSEAKNYVDGAVQDSGLTVFRAGPDDPSEETGAFGDFYFNYTTKILYGPKGDEGWGEGHDLIGPPGIQGERGPTGTPAAFALLMGD